MKRKKATKKPGDAVFAGWFATSDYPPNAWMDSQGNLRDYSEAYGLKLPPNASEMRADPERLNAMGRAKANAWRHANKGGIVIRLEPDRAFYDDALLVAEVRRQLREAGSIA